MYFFVKRLTLTFLILTLVVIGVAFGVAIFFHASSRTVATESDAIPSTLINEPIPLETLPMAGPSVRVNIAPTSTVPLITPPLDHLAAIAGDPPVQSRERSVRVPILMYHQIKPITERMTSVERRFDVSPETFAAQMETLLYAGYRFISPDDLSRALKGDGVLPSKPVMVTFDDGYRNQYENAFPVLKRLGIASTFFIVSRADTLRGFVTADMIKEMDKSGLVTIASHTQHHALLPRLSTAAQVKELVDSKKDLEDLLGHPVTSFAYPYGGWSVAIAKEVQDAGYQFGFGVRLGSLHTPSSLFQLRRMHVDDREDVVALCDRFSKPLRKSLSIAQP